MIDTEAALPSLSWHPIEAGCQPELEPYGEQAYLSDLFLTTEASGAWWVVGRHMRRTFNVGGQARSRDEARVEAAAAAAAILANLPAGARSISALSADDFFVPWGEELPDDNEEGRWEARLGPFHLKMIALPDMQWTWEIRDAAWTPIWTGYAYSELAAFRGADIHLRKAIETAGLTSGGEHATFYDALCRAIRHAKLPLHVIARERQAIVDLVLEMERDALATDYPNDEIPF